MDLYGRLVHDVLFPGFEALRGRPTLGLMRYLDRTQWASADELHAIQSGLLRRMVRHAYQHTTWYRTIFDERGLTPDDIRSAEDLVKLPLLERDHARGSIEARTSSAPPFATVKKITSGSTGQPMVVTYNSESRHWRDATRWRGYGWAGYRPGMKAVHYWGFGLTSPDRKTRWKIQLDRALNRNLYIDCTVRSDEHLRGVVEQIRRFQPEVLVTYSQAGAYLARYVLRTGSRGWGEIPVILGAERLMDHDRAAIVEAFGPAFETYGSREFMLTGAECEAHDGMHQAMETQVFEIIVRNPDGTTRAARPGESGECVITDLHNLAVPHLRYVNGDVAVQRPAGKCTCGRWLSKLGPIEGRTLEILRDARGEPVGGTMFAVLFLYLVDHALSYQVIQHADDHLTVRCVPIGGPGTLPKASHEFIHSFCAKYLPGIPVVVEEVADIPPGAAGKRRLVVVEPRASTSRAAASGTP
jgi:phenylacetate-CoA ligase